MLPTDCAITAGAAAEGDGVGVGVRVGDGVAVVLLAAPPEGELQAASNIASTIDAAAPRNQVIFVGRLKVVRGSYVDRLLRR